MTPTLPAKTVVLQERDLALVHMLTEEFRILSREQIGELFPMGSTTRLNLRLKQLRDAGYLSARPLSGLGAAIKPGYYLGPRANELFDGPTETRVVVTIRRQGGRLSEAGLAPG